MDQYTQGIEDAPSSGNAFGIEFTEQDLLLSPADVAIGAVRAIREFGEGVRIGITGYAYAKNKKRDALIFGGFTTAFCMGMTFLLLGTRLIPMDFAALSIGLSLIGGGAVAGVIFNRKDGETVQNEKNKQTKKPPVNTIKQPSFKGVAGPEGAHQNVPLLTEAQAQEEISRLEYLKAPIFTQELFKFSNANLCIIWRISEKFILLSNKQRGILHNFMFARKNQIKDFLNEKEFKKIEKLELTEEKAKQEIEKLKKEKDFERAIEKYTVNELRIIHKVDNELAKKHPEKFFHISQLEKLQIAFLSQEIIIDIDDRKQLKDKVCILKIAELKKVDIEKLPQELEKIDLEMLYGIWIQERQIFANNPEKGLSYLQYALLMQAIYKAQGSSVTHMHDLHESFQDDDEEQAFKRDLQEFGFLSWDKNQIAESTRPIS